jgi:hypothetical protein
MPRFLTFAYTVDGNQMVEAYPVDDKPLGMVIRQLPDTVARIIVLTPSRNQARKLAHMIWGIPDNHKRGGM